VFWNKKINSDEYERLSKKIVGLEADIHAQIKISENLEMRFKQMSDKMLRIKKISPDDDPMQTLSPAEKEFVMGLPEHERARLINFKP